MNGFTGKLQIPEEYTFFYEEQDAPKENAGKQPERHELMC
jgi:hypothetical protein